MTKSKQIIAYKEANPTHKPSDVAKACGVATAYVYQVLHNAKKKTVKAVKPVVPTKGQETLRKEIKRLNEEVDQWRGLYLGNAETLYQYEQDVIGYRAVISYLQAQIDGIAV
jgi:hypothetical protein